MIRPSFGLAIVLLGFALLSWGVRVEKIASDQEQARVLPAVQAMASELGAFELCLSTEARYTRHLVQSDRVVVAMDHPGALDHFPSTMFFAPADR
jgi:hypothetical protein